MLEDVKYEFKVLNGLEIFMLKYCCALKSFVKNIVVFINDLGYFVYIIIRYVPSRPRALTKVKVKVKHVVGPAKGPKGESQQVDQFGCRQRWAPLGFGVARYGRHQEEASP